MTVTVTGASGDVTVTPSQLTFVSDGDSDNAWFKARPVTVSAAKDGDAEIDAAVTLGHTVRGGDYDRLRGVDSVRVTIRESQTKGITVDTTGMDIPEGETGIPEGGTGTYTVKLNSQPTGTVTVMVRGASGDVTVRPSRLTFTTSTWDEEQEVEVNAGQDADAESDAAVRLTHSASGGGYNGVTGGEVTVIIREGDTGTKGVAVSPRALTVTEGSTADTYTVVLNTEPTGTVRIRLTTGSLAEAEEQSLDVRPTTLTFTQRNWNIPQVVTVRAEEDDDGTPGSVTLMHTASGGGYDYDSGEMPNVVVTIRENDSAGMKVTPLLLQIVEGSSRTYTVALNTKPANRSSVEVAITVTGGTDDVSATPTPLIFTENNWSTPRTVTVHVDADATATARDGEERSTEHCKGCWQRR